MPTWLWGRALAAQHEGVGSNPSTHTESQVWLQAPVTPVYGRWGRQGHKWRGTAASMPFAWQPASSTAHPSAILAHTSNASSQETEVGELVENLNKVFTTERGL